MTLHELYLELERLLVLYPKTTDYDVVLVPHGRDPRQELVIVHRTQTTIQLEARA